MSYERIPYSPDAPSETVELMFGMGTATVPKLEYPIPIKENFLRCARRENPLWVPNSITDMVGMTTLDPMPDPASEEAVKPMIAAFRERADRIYALLRKIPGVRVLRPEGAFYIFPNVKAFGLDAVTFCRRLLEERHVAAVPGTPFGSADHVRFSYACSMDTIEEGMSRFASFCFGSRLCLLLAFLPAYCSL